MAAKSWAAVKLSALVIGVRAVHMLLCTDSQERTGIGNPTNTQATGSWTARNVRNRVPSLSQIFRI